MKRLRVNNFSSIEDADLTFRAVTVIIGPQASGKSVLCKLNYFFVSLIADEAQMLANQKPWQDFKSSIEDKFFKWFPVGSWGTGQFKISFCFGDHEVKLTRSKYAGEVSDKFRIQFSSTWEEAYQDILKFVPRIIERSSNRENDFMARFRVSDTVESMLRKMFGEDYISSQLFIPAARSFFTNLGRAIAVFANNDSLDPVTFEFGQIYAARFDSTLREAHGKRPISAYLEEVTARLLNGRLTRESNRNYLLTSDGRKMPMSALSSGQQELIPLLRTLPMGIGEFARFCYIEEPEAHLFPDAQSFLIEALATWVMMLGSSMQLVLTTHSPYVLAKFNNLIKAGAIGVQETKTDAVKAIVDEKSWLRKENLIAFAICDGILVNITDEDGLINGDYIDQVSDKNAEEFSKLLEVEYAS